MPEKQIVKYMTMQDLLDGLRQLAASPGASDIRVAHCRRCEHIIKQCGEDERFTPGFMALMFVASYEEGLKDAPKERDITPPSEWRQKTGDL